MSPRIDDEALYSGEGAILAKQAILKVRTAAALLKVHPNTMRSLVKRGEVPGVKIGRDWRFLESDLV